MTKSIDMNKYHMDDNNKYKLELNIQLFLIYS